MDKFIPAEIATHENFHLRIRIVCKTFRPIKTFSDGQVERLSSGLIFLRAN